MVRSGAVSAGVDSKDLVSTRVLRSSAHHFKFAHIIDQQVLQPVLIPCNAQAVTHQDATTQ